jgi:hypothetical protein
MVALSFAIDDREAAAQIVHDLNYGDPRGLVHSDYCVDAATIDGEPLDWQGV